MKSKIHMLSIISFFSFVSLSHASNFDRAFQERAAEILGQLTPELSQDSQKSFRKYVDRLCQDLMTSGDAARAECLQAALARGEFRDSALPDLAILAHVFARDFYGDEIIANTAELMKFKTFKAEMPNRENPEFIRQRDFLAELALKLGLAFRDVDGYVQEISIGAGERSFGITVHSDVVPVDEARWQGDPWAGIIKDGALWGRGAIDDKGPLATIMYAMRTLLDTGIPLKRRIVLMVGTDEESDNEDIKHYFQSNPAPDQTIVVDSDYPVICAEKGWCGSWLKLPRQSGVHEGRGYVIVDLKGGLSQSIVPAKAMALIRPQNMSISKALSELQNMREEFVAKRSTAQVDIARKGDLLAVNTTGHSVHASVPNTGHNALMDLLVFLNEHVKPLPNQIALMARFAAENIAFELNGRKLGIAHHDDFMGETTVSANLFETSDDTVMFMFNYRIPRGITLAQVDAALRKRYDSFEKAHGVKLVERRITSEPLYNDPQGEFIQELLGIYNRLTGENLVPRSIGGGTYAKRIPNAVVFGPNMPGDEYFGHQPNEHIRLEVLEKNIEILTHTLALFALEP